MTSIALLIVLIMINGLFSATEAALLTINTNKLKMMADMGDNKAIELRDYLKSTTKVLATIQLGITMAVLFASAIAAYGFAYSMTDWLISIELSSNHKFLYYIAIVVVTLILTCFVLVFGDMVPKRIGMKYADSLSYGMMGPMKVIQWIVRPVVVILTATANGIVRMMGIDPNELDAKMTEEEIRMMIDAGGDNGSIDESEKLMINNIFEFDNTSAGDIATHRTDIVAIPINATLEDITAIINQEKYSRIPVYEENIDNIVGIFHVKDMVKYILNDSQHITEEGFHLSDILMKPYFVPFSKKTDELFEEMQKNKVHIAIIIDEYGGTAGIVTMEDLLEEIVGSIFDEYDIEEEEEIALVGENTYLIKGTTSIDKVEEILNIDFSEEDYDTISGFLIGQLGRIPEEDEHLDIEVNGYLFKIENVEEKRIELIRVCKSEFME